ncbi:MAG TPA: ROK family protein [Polyangiaceae bacterium]|jgi:glucokinase
MTAGYAIGVDLGGTNLRVAAMRDDGVLLEKHVRPTDASDRSSRDVLQSLCDAVHSVMLRLESAGPLRGIGVGVPGILESGAGVLRVSPSLPGWRDVPVREELERRLGTAVVIENDANLAAVGERWRGAGRGDQDLCMLTLGTGVGGAVLRSGRPWRGANGMAGELGHMTLRPDGPLCACGARGCLERYASAAAVRRMAREAVEQGRMPSRIATLDDVEPETTARHVHELAVAGDPAAVEVFREVGVALGIALAGLVNALDLPTYIVGGGLSCAWDAFSPALFDELRRRSFVYVAVEGRTRIVRAEMPHDAGLFGACRLVLDAANVP